MSARGRPGWTDAPGADLFGKLGRFASVGAASTLLYAALGLGFSHGLDLTPFGATVAAYALASAFSYVAHRRVTFRSERAHAAAVPRFALTTACGFALAALLTLVVERLGLPYAVAVAATCLVVPTFSFLVLDRIVFAGPERNGS